MNIGELVLWGVPLLGIVGALVAYIKEIVPNMNQKLLQAIGGVMVAGGVFLAMSMGDITVLYPAFEVWGARVLWMVVGYLYYTGHLPLLNRNNVNRFAARCMYKL